jgi:type II secretory pathway pseudopilin PulG
MKTRTSSSAALAGKGFTVLELLAVTFTALLLAALILPVLAKSRARPAKINCISNIKQIGLGFRMWANEHSDEFPWQVPASQDGTLEYIEKGVIHSFRAISNG